MGSAMGKSGGHILDSLPTQGTLHVAMLGLDSAGKTTALYRLKFDQYLNTVPTIGFNCEKVHGTVGKAKGVQFLVWDVGGQEKLRPLWRSYTRCTDGILFVVDSVDFERMEEAKMELMRTAKCPENQGVPVLILANKQDLPGAREPKQLENLLGLSELLPIYPTLTLTTMSSCSSSTGNIVSGSSSRLIHGRSLTPTQYNQAISYNSRDSIKEITSIQHSSISAATTISPASKEHTQMESQINMRHYKERYTHTTNTQHLTITSSVSSSSIGDTTPYTSATNKPQLQSTTLPAQSYFKGWYIQPACAITGEGLQEGLEALYEMIIRRRKINKAHKKKINVH